MKISWQNTENIYKLKFKHIWKHCDKGRNCSWWSISPFVTMFSNPFITMFSKVVCWRCVNKPLQVGKCKIGCYLDVLQWYWLLRFAWKIFQVKHTYLFFAKHLLPEDYLSGGENQSKTSFLFLNQSLRLGMRGFIWVPKT